MDNLNTLLSNCVTSAADKRRLALDSLHKTGVKEAISLDTVTYVVERAAELSKSKTTDTLFHQDVIEVCSWIVETCFDVIVLVANIRDDLLTVMTYSLKSKDEDVRIFGTIMWRWLANHVGEAFRKLASEHTEFSDLTNRGEENNNVGVKSRNPKDVEKMRNIADRISALVEFWQAALKVFKASAYDKNWGLNGNPEPEELDARMKFKTWEHAIALDREMEKLMATLGSCVDAQDDDGSPLLKVRRSRGRPKGSTNLKRRASTSDASSQSRAGDNKLRQRRQSTPKLNFIPFSETDLNSECDINGNLNGNAAAAQEPVDTKCEVDVGYTPAESASEPLVEPECNKVNEPVPLEGTQESATEQIQDAEAAEVQQVGSTGNPSADTEKTEQLEINEQSAAESPSDSGVQADLPQSAVSSVEEKTDASSKLLNASLQRSPEASRNTSSNWDTPSTPTLVFSKFDSPSNRNSGSASKQSSIVSSRTHTLVSLARKRTFADANAPTAAQTGSPTSINESPARKLLAIATSGYDKLPATLDPGAQSQPRAVEVEQPAVVAVNCAPVTEQIIPCTKEETPSSNCIDSLEAPQLEVPIPTSVVNSACTDASNGPCVPQVSSLACASPRSILKRTSLSLFETPSFPAVSVDYTDSAKSASPSMPFARTSLFSPCVSKQLNAARSRMRASFGQSVNSGLAPSSTTNRRSLGADANSNWNWQGGNQTDSLAVRRSLTLAWANAPENSPSVGEDSSIMGSAARRGRRVCFAEQTKVAYYELNSTSTTIHYASNNSDQAVANRDEFSNVTAPFVVDDYPSAAAADIPTDDSSFESVACTYMPTLSLGCEVQNSDSEDLPELTEGRRRRLSLGTGRPDDEMNGAADVLPASVDIGVGDLISEPIALQSTPDASAGDACTTPPRSLPDAVPIKNGGRSCTFPDPDVRRRDQLPASCSPRAVGRRTHSAGACDSPLSHALPALKNLQQSSAPASPMGAEAETEVQAMYVGSSAPQSSQREASDIAVATVCEPFGDAVAFVSPPAFGVALPNDNELQATGASETTSTDATDFLASTEQLAVALSDALRSVSQQKANGRLNCELAATRSRLCEVWRMLNGAQSVLSELFAPTAP